MTRGIEVRVKYVGQIVAALMLATVTVPAVAQQLYSDRFAFLKAVRERDGAEATRLITQPGSVVVNSARDDDGNGALHILTRERDFTWLGFLLGRGADANVQNKEGMTPLMIAAQLGWVEGAERLLGSGAKVDLSNKRGETPLILAVQMRHLSMVRMLLGKGADPKRTDSVAGYSALDYAKQDGRGSSQVLKALEDAATKPKKAMGPSL
jgi:ankyrin repeat protein